MIIECPYCGKRDAREFTYVGDALRTPPALNAPTEEWMKYVYERQNPRGPHHEHWQHSHGCRQFMTVVRDTATHQIHDVTAIGPYSKDPVT